jgi:cytoskeleton protein RodZ
MPSAGDLLRGERLKRNRSLSDLASETCISTRYLAAIEADDAITLPGDFFHRSFIRQYASALGLAEAETKAILANLAPPAEIDPISALNLSQQFDEVEQRSKPLARIPTRVAAALFLVVLAGCSGLYAIWRNAQEAAEETDPVVKAALDSNFAEAAPVDPSPLPVAPESVLPAVPESVPGPVSDDRKITVDLSATEKTWVSLSSAGRTVFAGVLDASQSRNFALDESARLLTGNAAGLDVRMNGRSLGPLGSRGQVRMVLFSQYDYQILSPRRM